MFVLAFVVERAGAAAAGQPARHHPVHGDVRHHLFPDRPRRARVRRRPEGDDYRAALSAEGRDRAARSSAASCRCRRSTSPRRSSPPSWSPRSRVLLPETRIGRALRAVADSHQAALSVGISLEQIWVIVWFAAGIVALVTGIFWGARSDVSFALDVIALKALPVLILGGLTSVPGRHRRRPDHRHRREARRVLLGPAGRRRHRGWFAYVIALSFLLFRPQGLFGERIIERV